MLMDIDYCKDVFFIDFLADMYIVPRVLPY